MGSDLDIVNAARVSFDRGVIKLTDKDIGLIDFLVREKHDSCFRHCVMTFEIYAPLMVARQWYKHTVASTHLDDQLGWNESSRRYITENEEFYIPGVNDWRAAPENRKQGSSSPVDAFVGAKYTQAMRRITEDSLALYKAAIDDGIAPEQARLLLPAYSMYVRWRWTASVNAIMHFINLRNDSHAQSEIREYTKFIEQAIHQYYPALWSAWQKHR